MRRISAESILIRLKFWDLDDGCVTEDVPLSKLVKYYERLRYEVEVYNLDIEKKSDERKKSD